MGGFPVIRQLNSRFNARKHRQRFKNADAKDVAQAAHERPYITTGVRVEQGAKKFDEVRLVEAYIRSSLLFREAAKIRWELGTVIWIGLPGRPRKRWNEAAA